MKALPRQLDLHDTQLLMFQAQCERNKVRELEGVGWGGGHNNKAFNRQSGDNNSRCHF